MTTNNKTSLNQTPEEIEKLKQLMKQFFNSLGTGSYRSSCNQEPKNDDKLDYNKRPPRGGYF